MYHGRDLGLYGLSTARAHVEVGYFAQTQSQELNGDYTIYETIDREAQGEIRTRINDLLGAFMFGGEESEKKVSVLSGGERGRVAPHQAPTTPCEPTHPRRTNEPPRHPLQGSPQGGDPPLLWYGDYCLA